MMTPVLLLWDIDGTLVCTDRAGERAIFRALQELHGLDLQGKLPVDLRGRTDTAIVRELFQALDIAGEQAEWQRFSQAYLKNLAQTLPEGEARLQPGVPAVLDAVKAHPEIHQALLTGNLQEGARLKLSHLKIWHYFEFGAFADDSHIRNELGPFALRRAKEKLGLDFPPDKVFIIGDTPHDIACGQAIGAKTIAVATGAFSMTDLAKHNPTHVLPDLADIDGFLALVA